MSSSNSLASRPPFQPGQSVFRRKSEPKPFNDNKNSVYSHTESHHIIRFKAPPTHNTRQQARLAAKKRLERKHANALNRIDSGSVNGSVKSTTKLKTGNEGRGRDKQRSNSISRSLRRSLSSIRSKSTNRSRSKSRNIKILSSGGSVCSAKSGRSLRSAGSRVMTKVKSFRRSKSIGSTSSRRNWFGRRRKNKNGTGENFLFVKQDGVSVEPKKRGERKKTTGFLGLGFLCGSLEPVCSSLFCQGDDENLIGTVIGGDDETGTPDTTVEYDHDDPRF